MWSFWFFEALSQLLTPHPASLFSGQGKCYYFHHTEEAGELRPYMLVCPWVDQSQVRARPLHNSVPLWWAGLEWVPSVHVQDIPRQEALDTWLWDQMSTQLYNWAIACLWPTIGKEDATESKMRPKQLHYWQMTPLIVSRLSDTLSLVTSDT